MAMGGLTGPFGYIYKRNGLENSSAQTNYTRNRPVWFASDFRFLGCVGLCHAQGGLEFLSHNRKKEKKSCAVRTLQQSAAGVCGEPILCVCMCVGDPNALHPPWGPGLQVQALLIMVTGRIHR